MVRKKYCSVSATICLNGLEIWTKAGRTTVSSGKQIIVSWEKSGGYISFSLSFYSYSRKRYWDESLLKTCTASKQNTSISKRNILYNFFFKCSPFRILFCPMCVLGGLLYNWFDNIDFYSMSKGSRKLPLHLFPWEKQRDDSTPLCSVKLLGVNHHG